MRGGAADVWRVTDDRNLTLAAKTIRVNQGEDHKIKASRLSSDMTPRLI